MGCAMADLQILNLILFAAATFAAALVAGVAGFAFGIVAAAVWLYFLSPAETTALIVAFGLIVQGVAVWKLRKSLEPMRLLPFLLGGAIGVPIGVELLQWTSPASLRIGIGVGLVLYSLYSLIRPRLAPVTAGGKTADGAIGVLNGLVGGATGLAGIVATVWCTLRGWPRDEQRTVFQPVSVSVFLMTVKLYGRLDEAGFRAVVLGLLLVSGLGLVVRGS